MRAALALLLLACAGPSASTTNSPSATPASDSDSDSDSASDSDSDSPSTPLAVTIDDLPYVGPLAPGDTPEAAVQRMLASAEGVPITGFFTCHGRSRQAAWRAWMASPIEVANHTRSHRSIDDFADIASWRRDVETCQSALTADARGPVRYFRYPFLRTGSERPRRDAGFAALRELGLTRAPVSIDTSDWALARVYARDRDTAVARAYVDHVRRAARRYRDIARAAGHGDGDGDAPQVLLIHANALTADHLGALLDGLREDGFRFISLESALDHPLYHRPDGYVGGVGMSWLYRVYETPDAWAWDAAQLHAMRVRFEDQAERPAFDLDAELSIRRITERTYIVTHASPWPANSLVAEMADGTLLFVDTPYTDAATRSLLDWAATRFGPRPLVAINTHFHPDALGGNRALIEAGATVYASDLTARLARERSDSYPPSETFPSSEGLTLDLGEPVRVFHPGAAHSPDNVVVHLPARALLFGGCAVLAGEAPGNTADADLEAWPAAIDQLEALSPRWVIPGHGTRTDRDLLSHTRELGPAPK